MPARNHRVDEGVVASLNRTKARIDYALKEYEKAEMPLRSVESNIRQSIHTLKDIRRIILHSGDY